MIFSEILKNKKETILPDLYEWAETFDFEFDENGEKNTEKRGEVFHLLNKLRNDLCTEVDYNNIMFHIEQINYNEIKIQL